MDIKGISWIGVGTDHFAETLAFFSEVLGLKTAIVDGSVAMLHAGPNQIVEIFGEGTQGRALASPPIIAFEVADVAATRDELLAKGVELIGDIGSWNGFEWLKFRGPEGYVFAVQKTPPPGWDRAADSTA